MIGDLFELRLQCNNEVKGVETGCCYDDNTVRECSDDSDGASVRETRDYKKRCYSLQ